jgi:hypothetical protein
MESTLMTDLKRFAVSCVLGDKEKVTYNPKVLSKSYRRKEVTFRVRID